MIFIHCKLGPPFPAEVCTKNEPHCFLTCKITIMLRFFWIWGPGCYCESRAGIVPFPLQKDGFFHAWVQKCDSWSKFHHVFVPRQVLGQTIPITAKEKWKICPFRRTWCVGLFAGQKWCISETLETRFLAITWVSGILQYAHKAYPVKFYGLECWGWAVVAASAEVNPNPCNTHRSQIFV